jgi:hypothetical protein
MTVTDIDQELGTALQSSITRKQQKAYPPHNEHTWF